MKIEQYFRPRPLEWCGPAWKQPAIKFHKKYTPWDEHDGNGEILYKTPTKWRWRLLKTSLLCSRKVFFFGKAIPFFFTVSRRPTDPNFGHFPKKKEVNNVFKPFLCRTGVSVVDPFSHAVLILPQHPPTFPPYWFWVHVLLFSWLHSYDAGVPGLRFRECLWLFFLGFFFNPTDRPNIRKRIRR